MQLLYDWYLGCFGVILQERILTYNLVCSGFALFVCLKSAPAIQLFKYVGLPTKAIPLYFLQFSFSVVAIWRMFVTFVVDYDNSRKGFDNEYNDNKEETCPRTYICSATIAGLAWP